jgi:hypothetical protein
MFVCEPLFYRYPRLISGDLGINTIAVCGFIDDFVVESYNRCLYSFEEIYISSLFIP